jgi:CHAT domain-containing protein/uncharacterized protein HemY
MNRSIALALTGLLTIAPVTTAASAIGVQAQTVDARKVEADRVFQQAVEQIKTKQAQAALKLFEQALLIYREIKDREREGRTLGSIGLVYAEFGNNTQAIKYYEQRLVIAKELNDRRSQATAVTNLGNAHAELNDYNKAIEYYEQRLAISRELKDRIWEGKSLRSLGNVYQSLGDYQKAIKYYEKGLEIFRLIEDKQGEAKSLSDLGLLNKVLNNYAQSIDYQERSLAIFRAIKSYEKESEVLSFLGQIYRSLADYPKAIQYQEESLGIAQGLKNRLREGEALGGLGSIYTSMGNYSKAIEYHEKSVAIMQDLKNRFSEGQAIGNLGSSHLSAGNYQKAIELLQRRLKIAQEFNDRSGEAYALHNLGTSYYKFSNSKYYGDLDIFRSFRPECSVLGKVANCTITSDPDELSLKAIEYFRRSLPLSRKIQNRDLEQSTLSNIGGLLKYHDSELSIVFYKKSINIAESIRQNNQGLNRDLQISYTETVAESYRTLASLLIQRNRIVEGLQILDLLKVQDLQDFLKDFKGNDRTRKGIELLPQEEAIFTSFNNSSADLNTFLKSSTIQTQTKSLRENAAAQNLQLDAYRDLQTRIKKLGKNVALFYPLILEDSLALPMQKDRLELVILTNDRPPIRKPIAIPKDQLKTEIETFRKQLQARDRLIKPRAQKLYQTIIQPIEAELKAANVDTIVYAPDDIMRYIPLAALHDGKQWLAEKYQINYLTALALTPIEPDKNTTPRILAAALTEPKTIQLLGQTLNFSALNYTQPEIEILANTIPNTTQLLNPSFNRTNLTANLPTHTILHLATHGYFVPNNPEQSIILLGDGTTLNLREIEQQWKLPNVSLVVLSACETAIGGKLGNGIEILGFGYQMQRIGSRASISSLWTIDDGGTQGFMNTFYRQIKQGKTIAAAIQTTQRAFINKEITPTAIASIRASGKRHISGGIPDDLTHPYYWAPFLLIGNGL